MICREVQERLPDLLLDRGRVPVEVRAHVADCDSEAHVARPRAQRCQGQLGFISVGLSFREIGIAAEEVGRSARHVLDEIAEPLAEISCGHPENSVDQALLDADIPRSRPFRLEVRTADCIQCRPNLVECRSVERGADRSTQTG